MKGYFEITPDNMVQDFKKFLYHEVTIVLLKELG